MHSQEAVSLAELLCSLAWLQTPLLVSCEPFGCSSLAVDSLYQF